MCIFDFFGTDDFHNHYNNPGNKLDTERDWFKNNVWNDIEDDTASTYVWENTVVQADVSGLCDRLAEADNWLEQNFDFYASSDCAIVLDYYESDTLAGCAYVCNAGESDNKTALIDYGSTALYSFDYDLAVPHRRYLGQEPGHVFCAEHNDGGVTSADEVTYMWESEANTYCYDNGTKDGVAKVYTYCAEDAIDPKTNNC